MTKSFKSFNVLLILLRKARINLFYGWNTKIIYIYFSSPKVRGAYYTWELYNSLFFWPCLTIKRSGKLKVSYIYSPNWCVLCCYREIFTGMCLFIILFLLMWAYFPSWFLCKHVHVFCVLRHNVNYTNFYF